MGVAHTCMNVLHPTDEPRYDSIAAVTNTRATINISKLRYNIYATKLINSWVNNHTRTSRFVSQTS